MPTEPDSTYNVEVIHNLPIKDGMPTLDLNDDTWQTIHMIDIEVTDYDNLPISYADINFESNLYWELGDTLGYFIHRWLTDGMEYVTYDTSYVIGGGLHDLVPTTNYGSMTDSDGWTRNAIAPIRTMANDTLVLTIDVWAHGKGQIIKTLKIKLEE